MAPVLPVAARLTRWVIANTKGRISEPEVKFVFLMMLFLGCVATAGGSEAILPAYLLAMVLQAKLAGVELTTVTLAGHAAQRIVEYAGVRAVDLLVLGHSGHTGVWGQFLGTTADKIVRHAPCSVLVVR